MDGERNSVPSTRERKGAIQDQQWKDEQVREQAIAT